jgi:hypothetical protein
VADFHRLHADDEGVRQRRQEQQGGRGAACGRLPLREMNRVDHRGGGVENEGNQIQRDVGA